MMSVTRIGIICGSKSDWPLVERALKSLESLDIPCAVRIASAHRTPESVEKWIKEAERAGVEVIIAVAGLAAALPGVAAAHTLLPVIGVPVDAGPLKGQDALYSIVQMPPGIPVATVGVNNVKNALILALRILALRYPEYRKRLASYQKSEAAKVESAHDKLMEEYPRYALRSRPKKKEPAGRKTRTPPQKTTSFISEESLEQLHAESGTPAPPVPKKKRSGKSTWRMNPENPEFDIVEKIADIILDGGVVAIPTDTVYGLACDSTNPKAVRKLYALKGRDQNKPIPLLIDGMRTLKKLVRSINPEVDEMLEDVWPGALTVVFPKPETMLSAVSAGPSIGIRNPDSIIALSVISMVARPLAVTSANPSGQPPATTADMVEGYFGRYLDAIVDGGPTRGESVSSVISVLEEPYQLIREGVLTYEVLKGYLETLEKK